MRHSTTLARLGCYLLACITASLITLPAVGAQPSPAGSGQLAVYLDCQASCDQDFIRTEINWVNWVRDRTVADVHVLITSQSAGSGGEQFTLAFLGSRALTGRGDTLTFNTIAGATADERRRGVTQTLALGLVSYVARTPAGMSLRVTKSGDDSDEAQTATGADPWKAWVFEIEIGGSVNGEKFYRNRDVNAQFSANRITKEWKTSFNYENSYRDNRATVQEFDDAGVVIAEETFSSVRRDWEAQFGLVKSVTDHGGVGMELELASQTFRNQRLRGGVKIAAEYNIFPYAESTRRELTFRYGVGVTSYRYADTTIFNKINETLPLHFIEASYRTRQPWGQANVNAEHRNFLNDASKRTTELNGNISVRLFRGFSVNFGGGYNWIRDQIYLAREEQNAIDVLLRRRALLTGFEYYANAGISYTFGSIFNNVVNPRF